MCFKIIKYINEFQKWKISNIDMQMFTTNLFKS